MAELADAPVQDVAAVEVRDYVNGGYRGEFHSPPHADQNARRAVVVVWKDRPYRFVFWHEANYCAFFPHDVTRLKDRLVRLAE
jgi:hypothetical protein